MYRAPRHHIYGPPEVREQERQQLATVPDLVEERGCDALREPLREVEDDYDRAEFEYALMEREAASPHEKWVDG